MSNFDFSTTTSDEVIGYLKKKFDLSDEDKSFLRITINKALSSAWEEGKHTNGCDCGQMSCPICNP